MGMIEEGTKILYGLRSRKTGAWVCIRKERNPRDRYACCETSHYAYLPDPKWTKDGIVWLRPSADSILDCLTKDTRYYNASDESDPVLEFDMEDDELEIVEVQQTIKLKVVPNG